MKIHNARLLFFLILALCVVIIFTSGSNLIAQGASQTPPQEHHYANHAGFSVMWVILATWCALSLYLLYIDRKISKLEKKGK